MKVNNKGSTLVMLVLILAILSILGTSLLSMSVNENKLAIKEHDYQQAYYIARAGAEATAKYLSNNHLGISALNQLISSSSSDMTNKDATDFGGGSFKVSLLKASGSDDLFIQSEGAYEGLTRTVKLMLEKKEFFSCAVTVLTSISIENPSNCNIYGDLATVGDPTTSVTDKHGNPLSETEINHILYDNSTSTQYALYQSGGTFPKPMPPSLSLTSGNKDDLKGGLIENEMTDLFANTVIGDLNLGNSDLTIDLKNDDMVLIFDDLEANNSTITVTGNGLLKLYVNNIDDFKGDIIIGSHAKVVLLVRESGTIALKTGSSTANLYIYAPFAEITLKANYLLIGSIIANDVTLSAGADIEFSPVTGVFPDDLGIDTYSYERTEWSY